MISADTTIAALLDHHPALLEVLVGYHPHFQRLRNRLVRRVFAPRATIAQAAAMAGVPADALLATLLRAAGEEPPAPAEAVAPAASPAPPAPRPPWVDRAPAMVIDVHDDIRRGAEPFGRIMAAVKALDPARALVLRAPFEPVPLYDVLGKRGFAHWAERLGDDDWSVWFHRIAGEPAPARPSTSAPADSLPAAVVSPPAVVATLPAAVATLPAAAASLPAAADSTSAPATLDVRGLEAPLPMLRVLERLEALAPGEELHVLHDRRPRFLYPLLDDRGFVHATDEPEPGLIRIVICRGRADADAHR